MHYKLISKNKIKIIFFPLIYCLQILKFFFLFFQIQKQKKYSKFKFYEEKKRWKKNLVIGN